MNIDNVSTLGLPKDLMRLRAVLPITLKEIITHPEPSIDDAVAITGLVYHSENYFNTSEGVEVNLMGHSEIDNLLNSYDGDSIKLLQETGSLIVGAGGSILDEHAHKRNNHIKKDGECAASLVTKLLEITDPAWMKIVKYALDDDTGNRSDHKNQDCSLTLPNLMKAAYHFGIPDDDDWIINHAIHHIEAMFRNYKHRISTEDNWQIDTLTKIAHIAFANENDTDWIDDAKKRFMEAHEKQWQHDLSMRNLLGNVEVIETVGPRGKIIRIGYFECDEVGFHKIAINNLRLHVMILGRSTGHYQAFTKNNSKIYLGLRLDNVITLLRAKEMEIAGITNLPVGNILRSAGAIEQCDEWYLYSPDLNDMIFNQSRTSGEVPATRLTDEQVKSCFVNGLNPNYFEPTRMVACTSGFCSSYKHDLCPFDKLGLQQCRAIRYEQRILEDQIHFGRFRRIKFVKLSRKKVTKAAFLKFIAQKEEELRLEAVKAEEERNRLEAQKEAGRFDALQMWYDYKREEAFDQKLRNIRIAQIPPKKVTKKQLINFLQNKQNQPIEVSSMIN